MYISNWELVDFAKAHQIQLKIIDATRWTEGTNKNRLFIRSIERFFKHFETLFVGLWQWISSRCLNSLNKSAIMSRLRVIFSSVHDNKTCLWSYSQSCTHINIHNLYVVFWKIQEKSSEVFWPWQKWRYIIFFVTYKRENCSKSFSEISEIIMIQNIL